MSVICLDHNATSPLYPAAAEAMCRAEADGWGNPSSAHSLGRKARQYLEDAREKIAHLLDAKPEEVVFTSGATEANNLALFGQAGEPPGSLVSSLIEHPCVVEPLRELERRGFAVHWLRVDSNGCVSIAAALEHAEKGVRLAAIMLANHETGAVQDVAAIAKAMPVHCDAAQAVGKMPVSFAGLGVATLSLSGHKFRGPRGIGALLVRKGVELKPLQFGGHQQRGRRPGTECPVLAVGMAVALEHALDELPEHTARWRRLRREFIEQLQAEVPPVVVNGDGLPSTLNLSFPGCRADLLLVSLDLAGVACSTGSACSSGSLLPSPVLQAMGVPPEVLASAMRFSFGAETSELDEAIERIVLCVRAARKT